MSILNLTTDNFDEALENGPVLVDFWADWCMPCKLLAPTIEELNEEFGGRITVAKVDIDSEDSLAMRYSVMSIPTVILFKDGLEAQRFVGVQPKEIYQEALQDV